MCWSAGAGAGTGTMRVTKRFMDKVGMMEDRGVTLCKPSVCVYWRRKQGKKRLCGTKAKWGDRAFMFR